MTEKDSSKNPIWSALAAAVVFLGAGFMQAMKPGPVASNDDQEAVARIRPLATFTLPKAEAVAEAAPAPAAAAGPRDGATIYNAVCSACHNTGAAGAPKIDDKAAWAPRLATGKDALIASVTNGKNAMPAKGGTTLSEEEIRNVVEYVMGKAK